MMVILESIEYDRTTSEQEELEFKEFNALGFWDYTTSDELWTKIEKYMGTKLHSITFCDNRPHTLTSFK